MEGFSSIYKMMLSTTLIIYLSIKMHVLYVLNCTLVVNPQSEAEYGGFIGMAFNRKLVCLYHVSMRHISLPLKDLHETLYWKYFGHWDNMQKPYQSRHLLNVNSLSLRFRVCSVSFTIRIIFTKRCTECMNHSRTLRINVTMFEPLY